MDAIPTFLDAVFRRPVLSAIGTLVVVLVTQFVWRGYQHRRFYRNLPGPPHSWLWGHLALISELESSLPPNSHPMAHYTEIARRYKLEGIFYLDLWPVLNGTVVLSDPELTEHVTVTKPLPIHSLADEMFAPVVGLGLVAVANGALWRKLHNAMAPAFSLTHVRRLTEPMVDECRIFRRNLDRQVANGEVFSMEEVIARLVFDIIVRVVTAKPMNAQTSDAQELNDFRELVALAEGQFDLTKAYNPIAQFRWWWWRRQILSRLDPPLISQIRERLSLFLNEQIVPSRKNPYSILDLMLREHAKEQIEAGEEGRPTLSNADEKILLTNIKGLLLGAHGTSTDTLCYTYMLLSKSPEVVEKMRQEHVAVFSSDFETAMNTAVERPELLQSLPYTESVLKESMRMFPIGYIIRQAPPGTKLSYKGRDLPIDNDLIIALQAHDAHYNPKYFPEPDKFRPERWLEGEGIPPQYFMSFGRGPRACTGRNLALNELKLVLLATIGDYEFECAGLEPNVKQKTSYTSLDTVFGDIIFQEMGMEAKPRGGMMMTAKRRT